MSLSDRCNEGSQGGNCVDSRARGGCGGSVCLGGMVVVVVAIVVVMEVFVVTVVVIVVVVGLQWW